MRERENSWLFQMAVIVAVAYLTVVAVAGWMISNPEVVLSWR